MEAESLVPVAEAVLEPRSWDSRTLSGRWLVLIPRKEGLSGKCMHHVIFAWVCVHICLLPSLDAGGPNGIPVNLWRGRESRHAPDRECSKQKLTQSPRTATTETEGNAHSALETFTYINDFVNDSFCCILVISLYKGIFFF